MSKWVGWAANIWSSARDVLLTWSNKLQENSRGYWSRVTSTRRNPLVLVTIHLKVNLIDMNYVFFLEQNTRIYKQNETYLELQSFYNKILKRRIKNCQKYIGATWTRKYAILLLQWRSQELAKNSTNKNSFQKVELVRFEQTSTSSFQGGETIAL